MFMRIQSVGPRNFRLAVGLNWVQLGMRLAPSLLQRFNLLKPPSWRRRRDGNFLGRAAELKK